MAAGVKKPRYAMNKIGKLMLLEKPNYEVGRYQAGKRNKVIHVSVTALCVTGN